jgi:hypothetical protein
MKDFIQENIEALIVLSILAAFGLVKVVLSDKVAFLNIYFIPVLLAGYYLGRKPAILTSIASVLLMVIFFIRWPAEFGPAAGGQLQAGLSLIVWGCFLVLVTIMVSTINENRQRRMALATLNLLEKYLRRATNGDGPESHVARVATLAMAIARDLRIPSDFLIGIEAAGLLHDIGDSDEGFDMVENTGAAHVTAPGSTVDVALPILIAARGRQVRHADRAAVRTSARILAIADVYDELTERDADQRYAPWPAVEELERRHPADRALTKALRHVVQRQLTLEPATS